MELTLREKTILSSVVQSFIIKAMPVSSGKLFHQYHFEYSPATIRNIMADLEALGLLEQPHTSAGRIPTDLGYRIYVNELMEHPRLTPALKEIMEEEFSEPVSNIEEILQRSSELLGRLSNLLGVVISPKIEEGVLQKLDLVKIAEERLLVIVTIKSGMVKSIILGLNFAIDDSQINVACRILNERLQGLTLRKIRGEICQRVREIPVEAPRELIAFIVENAPQVFHLEETGGFYQAGLKKLMLQPEFNRTEKLRSIVELLEDKVGLTQLLCRARLEDGVRITIGHENPVKGTQTLSVISSAFGLGDNLGSVNVMGPTRMNYSRLCSIVDYTAKLIQKKLNQ